MTEDEAADMIRDADEDEDGYLNYEGSLLLEKTPKPKVTLPLPSDGLSCWLKLAGLAYHQSLCNKECIHSTP